MSLILIQEIKTKGAYDYEAIKKADVLETEAKTEYVKKVLNSLKETFTKHKITYILGDYEGGNDSGGFEHVYFADDQENIINIKKEDEKDFRIWVDKKKIYRYENEKAKKLSVFYTKNYVEKNLIDELEDMIYATGALSEYGSFAGEFSCHGTVKLNVLTHDWTRDGNETSEGHRAVEDEGCL